MPAAGAEGAQGRKRRSSGGAAGTQLFDVCGNFKEPPPARSRGLRAQRPRMGRGGSLHSVLLQSKPEGRGVESAACLKRPAGPGGGPWDAT